MQACVCVCVCVGARAHARARACVVWRGMAWCGVVWCGVVWCFVVFGMCVCVCVCGVCVCLTVRVQLVPIPFIVLIIFSCLLVCARVCMLYLSCDRMVLFVSFVSVCVFFLWVCVGVWMFILVCGESGCGW